MKETDNHKTEAELTERQLEEVTGGDPDFSLGAENSKNIVDWFGNTVGAIEGLAFDIIDNAAQTKKRKNKLNSRFLGSDKNKK